MTPAFDPLAASRRPWPAAVDTHDLVSVEVDGDPASDYRVLVPKTWAAARRFATPRRGDLGPVPIGAFAAVRDPSSPVLVITKRFVGENVRALDLLVHDMTAEGGRVLGATMADGPHGSRLQIAAVHRRDSLGLRVCTAHVDGGRLFAVDAIASERLFPAAHDLFAPCGPSFALAQPTGVPRLGRSQTVESGRLGLELPSGWRWQSVADGRAIDADPADGSRLRALVRLWPMGVETSADALARRWRSTMVRSGLVVENCTDHRGPTRCAEVEIAGTPIDLDVRGASGPRVLTVASKTLDAGVLDVALLAPPLRDDVDAWLRVRGFLDLALSTARTRS